jgi:hypothetical protein
MRIEWTNKRDGKEYGRYYGGGKGMKGIKEIIKGMN